MTRIPVVLPADISGFPEQLVAGRSFTCSLTSGEKVTFAPLAWTKWETPRILLIYAEISRSINVQKLFGVYHHQDPSSLHYTVMQDLGSPFVMLRDALRDQVISKATRIQRLRICYDIAQTVAYLHSVNIIVKVISESSFYIDEADGEFVAVLTNLEHSRLVLSGCSSQD
jgi:serine/threonine protein kinase